MTDSQGAPVANIPVAAAGYSYTQAVYKYFTGSVQTDANGHYEILVFTGDTDTLSVVPPSPLGTQVEYGVSVQGDMTRDFALSDSTVSGQVRGYAGVGIAGISVQVMDSFNMFASVVVSTTTDSQGQYQVNLASGTYVVRLQSSDSLPNGAPNGFWYDYLNNQTTTGTLDFDLPVAKVHGVVTDSSGTPVANVAVSGTAYDYSSSAYSYFAGSVQTDASGHYELLVLTGTNETLTVTPPAPQATVIQTGVSVGGDITRDFTLSDTTVSGRVRGYGGIGMAGVSVEVLDSSNSSAVASTTTDSQGQYVLSLGAGNYTFRLQPPFPLADGAPNGYWYEYLYNQTTSGTRDFDLPVAGVQGVVTDFNGAPVPNVSVSAGAYDYSQSIYTYFAGSVQTDASGHYMLLVFTGTNDTFTVTPPTASGFSITALSNVAVTGDFTQTIVLENPDLSPPVIVSGPGVIHLSDTSVSINWQTNEPANSLADYGVGGLTASVTSPALVTTHEVTLVGLLPSTVYQYRVSSTDAMCTKRWGSRQASTTIRKARRQESQPTAAKRARSAELPSDVADIGNPGQSGRLSWPSYIETCTLCEEDRSRKEALRLRLVAGPPGRSPRDLDQR